MKRLISIVCVDDIKFFELNYYYDINGKVIKEKKIVSKKKNEIESIIEKYPVANFYEREIFETFGISFKKRE